MKSSLASLFVLVAAALTASGAPFVVTNTNDSGPGSLRQAIIDANDDRTTPAPHVITFNIPGPGVHTIAVQSALPSLNSVITIDGYTQPGAKPNSLAVGTNAVLLIEINGSNLPAGQTGITLGFAPGDGHMIRGLVVNGFTTNVNVSQTGLHKVVGCYLGTNPAGSKTVSPSSGTSVDVKVNGTDFGISALIGSATPADRNVVGFEIIFSSGTFPPSGGGGVQGNYVGISADGRSFINPNARVFVVDLPVVIGGANGAGNVIGGRVVLIGTNGVLLQGNLIGTDATGTVTAPGAGGLDLSSGSISHVAVPTRNTAVRQNVIVSSDPSRPAVVSIFGSTDNTFQQNFIGLAADGKTPMGNRPQGIALAGRAMNNTIGGTSGGAGNVIAFAAPTPVGSNQPAAAGVTDGGTMTVGYGRNFIEGNSITGSGGLGIDLAAKGVTPNDIGDTDGIQNYPVLSSAVFANGTVRVTGSLNSKADSSFRIELFGNDNADPSGYGQGQYFLGFASVTTDSNGNASFDVTLPAPASATAISSTATGPTGTSEFSAALFAKLLNISSRANVQLGDDLVIGGFIITGTDAKKVLLRGIGPSLNIAGHLQDPVIALYDSSGSFILVNNNWKDSQQEEIEATGLAPSDRLESAVLVTLPPAAYTVQLRGRDGGAGIALVEVYDLGQPGSRLANISTRARVESGDSVMIGGVIIGPNNGRNSRVLIRGLGPSLTDVPEPLQDPTIELWDGNGALLARNDDWKTNEAQVAPTGLAPTDEHESALVADLAPGNYTAIVRDKDSMTGVGLVEIYHL